VRAAAALEAHPEEAVFHELTARALRAASAPTEPVREIYQRAVELDPKHAPALAGLAELALEAGDVERALVLYDRAAKAAPDQSSSAYAAIRLLLEQGRNSEAQSRLTALLKRHPREARAAAALARRLVERESDLDRALALARRAALFGPSGESFEVLGSVQLARGELQPAIEALNHSLELDPDAQSARYQLARALEAAGDEN
jgi:tetratricopeptide (TPR) repeat protein